MDGYKIPIFVESRYKVNRKRLTNTIKNLLKEKGVQGPMEVSVAIVGSRKMRALTLKYKGVDKDSNVLSFSLTEGETPPLPQDVLRLGDVVISYPQVIKEASEEEMLVDEKIDELAMHGVLHLLGEHH